MLSDKKEGDLQKPVIDYIYNVGNRISQVKYDLVRETKETFPNYSVMVTYLPQAELLKMLVQLTGAKKGIEIGVFTGISSLCMAEGLPDDGKLICLDVSEEFTNLARKYWKIAQVDHKIELIIDSGIISLQKILENLENLNSFDFAYVDADKPNYLNYYEALLKLLKPNGFIIFDNTLWSHKVAYENYQDENTLALKKLNKFLNQDERVTINQINIGDGMTIVRKK
jgi:predicted O-methyltransferase YrrM